MGGFRAIARVMVAGWVGVTHIIEPLGNGATAASVSNWSWGGGTRRPRGAATRRVRAGGTWAAIEDTRAVFITEVIAVLVVREIEVVFWDHFEGRGS